MGIEDSSPRLKQQKWKCLLRLLHPSSHLSVADDLLPSLNLIQSGSSFSTLISPPQPPLLWHCALFKCVPLMCHQFLYRCGVCVVCVCCVLMITFFCLLSLLLIRARSPRIFFFCFWLTSPVNWCFLLLCFPICYHRHHLICSLPSTVDSVTVNLTLLQSLGLKLALYLHYLSKRGTALFYLFASTVPDTVLMNQNRRDYLQCVW